MVCKLNFIYIIYIYIIYISLKFTFCTPTQKLLTLLTIDYLFRKESVDFACCISWLVFLEWLTTFLRKLILKKYSSKAWHLLYQCCTFALWGMRKRCFIGRKMTLSVPQNDALRSLSSWAKRRIWRHKRGCIRGCTQIHSSLRSSGWQGGWSRQDDKRELN